MSEKASERLEEVKEAVLCLSRNRDASALSFKNPLVQDLERLNWWFNKQSFYDWAFVNLDVWGIEQCLSNKNSLSSDILPKFLTTVSKLDETNPAEGMRFMKEIWPLLWACLRRTNPLNQRMFSFFTLGDPHYTKALRDARRLDIPDGPYSKNFHDRIYESVYFPVPWEGMKRLWLSPLQWAWANQDSVLCGVLLKNGAGLETQYEHSSWPTWSLKKVLDDPASIVVADPPSKDITDPARALQRAFRLYQETPDSLFKLCREIREPYLEHALPPPGSSRAKLRF